jgi:hypothetical protein
VKLTLVVTNKWTSDWDSHWFYCKVPSEPVGDVRGKVSYLLRSTMNPLEYLTEAPFECGPSDVNMVTFVEVALIISGHDAVEEFLACDIWPLSEKHEFGMERKVSKWFYDTSTGTAMRAAHCDSFVREGLSLLDVSYRGT